MKKKADPARKRPRPSALQIDERKQRSLAAKPETATVVDAASLLSDLRSLIQSARQRIATAAYSTQTLLCWHVGRRLSNENLQSGRAAYGRQILATVSRELTAEYGRGFSHTEITRMIQFSQLFPDEAIVVTLSQQLTWSHVHALLPIKDPLAGAYYAEMCRIERWDVRTLRQKIGGMLYQRTALSKKPQAVISAEIAKLRKTDHEIVLTLSTQLSWSHFIEPLPIRDLLAREFYKDFFSIHGERVHRREQAGIVAEVVA